MDSTSRLGDGSSAARPDSSARPTTTSAVVAAPNSTPVCPRGEPPQPSRPGSTRYAMQRLRRERETLRNDLMEVLQFLVIPTQCYHLKLEAILEEGCHLPSRPPCGNSCSFCLAGGQPKFSGVFKRDSLIHILRSKVLINGAANIDAVYKALNSKECRSDLYGKSQHQYPAGTVQALVLQLVASNILEVSLEKPSLCGTNDLERKHLLLNFGFQKDDVTRGTHCRFAHDVDANWKSISSQPSLSILGPNSQPRRRLTE